MLTRDVRIAALAIGIAASATSAVSANAPPNPLIVKLHPAAGGSPDGSASLFEINNTIVTNVMLEKPVDNATASIVDGTCAQPGKVAYTLTDTVNGQSLTRVPNAQLSDVAHGKRAIVVRRGHDRNASVIACGEIPS